ncbi:uncharacterized protein LOC143038000 [Oratosquilla oratoria]|uniref:uncharacterized protein LOC143038000 n=1 Tax=Oratosquilla oratoria TaxID=337810 RepID=UPI003F75A66B
MTSRNVRKRSAVWTFFDDGIGTSEKVVCQICGEKIVHSGNTSNMIRHLKIKHPGEYRSGEVKRKKEAPGTSKTSQPLDLENFRHSRKYPEDIQAAFSAANPDYELSVKQVEHTWDHSKDRVNEQHNEYKEKLMRRGGPPSPPPPDPLSCAPTIMGRVVDMGDQPYNSMGLLRMDEEGNEVQDAMTMGRVCKARWVNQTDHCHRPLESKQTISEQEAGKKRYKMTFGKPLIQKQETVSSFDIDFSENIDEIDFSDEKDSATFGTLHSSHSENSLHDLAVNKSNVASKLTRIKQEVTEPTEDNICVCIPKSLSSNAKNTQSSIIEAEASVLLKYILDQKKDVPRPTNPIDAFLYGIGETIKSFPPLYQHMAKSKISSVVSDIELELLLKTQGTSDFKVSEGSPLLHSTISTPSSSQETQNSQMSYHGQEEAGSPESSDQSSRN